MAVRSPTRSTLSKNNLMSRLLVRSFGMSIDGYSAGPNQSLDNPLGVNGAELMDWFFHTRVWREMHGQPGGDTGVDDEMAKQGFENMGAWILGRNMFGPVRGPWPDDRWNGCRCCSAPASRYSPASIYVRWATSARDTSRENARCTCSSAGVRDRSQTMDPKAY